MERISGDKWSIGIRGFGSRLARSVLVLIDGRSVYTTLLAGTYWEVQDTVIEDIDRIEVIRGPGGTVWGPNAVQGVINIITKNSKDTQGALASLISGNGKSGILSARYGGSNANGLSYRVHGKGFDRGPQFHPDGNNNDRWAAVQGGFRMDWVKNERDSFTLQGGIYDERAGESVTLTSWLRLNKLWKVTLIFPAETFWADGPEFSGKATTSSCRCTTIERTATSQISVISATPTTSIFSQRFHAGSRNHFSWGLDARASHGHDIEVSSGLFFSPSTQTDQLYTAIVDDNISLLPESLGARSRNKTCAHQLQRARARAQRAPLMDAHEHSDRLGGHHARRPYVVRRRR